MKDSLYIELTIEINSTINNKSINTAISDVTIENQSKFTPYFDRLIDMGDARVSIFEEGLEISDINISNNSGVVDVVFTSEFYAGCKDMDSTTQHDETLEFKVVGNKLIFDIELPPAWLPDQYE